MATELRSLAFQLTERAFLGSKEVFQEAWDALMNSDGRSHTGACGLLVKCCETCIGYSSLREKIFHEWPDMAIFFSQINISYAVSNVETLSDKFWLELFKISNSRVQRIIFGGFAQTALHGHRDKRILRNLITMIGRHEDLDIERQKKYDDFVKRVVDSLGS